MPNQKSIWLTSAPKKCIIVMKKSSAVNLKNQECKPSKPLRLKRLIRVWRSLVSRLNGVQEALSSNLSTRTKTKGNCFRSCLLFLLSAPKCQPPCGPVRWFCLCMSIYDLRFKILTLTIPSKRQKLELNAPSG